MAILTLEQKKALIEEQREAGRRQEATRTAHVPNFEDVRLMIREEIRAALREERNFAPHPDLLTATHCHRGVPQAQSVQGINVGSVTNAAPAGLQVGVIALPPS